MIFNPPKIYLLVLLLLATSPMHGQVLVKISADKEHIQVGEPLMLTVEARLPLGENLKWISLDTIAHFEWIDKGNQLLSDGLDGKKVWQVIKVTSYDTGYWVIPRMNIKVASKTYSTDTLGIRVGYSANFNPEENYRDIKETEEVQEKTNTTRWWVIGGASLVLLLALIFILLKRLSAGKGLKIIEEVSAYAEAMQAIAMLRKQDKMTDGDVKLYYTRMNNVLRNYVSRQFQLPTLEKTNDELVIQMKRLNLSADQFTSLAQTLRMADFVKFARYLPSAAENEKALAVIESVIISLNKSPS